MMIIIINKILSIVFVILFLFICIIAIVLSFVKDWLENNQEVEDMTVYEALELVIKELEDNASCGRLGDKLREAKHVLHNYVITKLAEDKGKENNE